MDIPEFLLFLGDQILYNLNIIFDINLENNKECVIDVEEMWQMALGVRIA
jgi:hypothetical protein